MPFSLTFDIAIIGGGAAGFFVAITSAELAGSHPIKIIILEKTHRPLGKVLISGGGRCNVTHACFDPAQLVTFYPRGGTALRGAFSRFQPADTIAWFEAHGVPLKTESDGRIFPHSDSSGTIANCLLKAAQDAGIDLWINTAVKSLSALRLGEKPGFRLLVKKTKINDKVGEDQSIEIYANYVLIATGGDRASFGLVSSLGHKIEPPVPSLFSFKISDSRLEGLAGVSVDSVGLSLESQDPNTSQKTKLLNQEGPLLVTHWGLSGPAVLKLSAWEARWLHDLNYQATLKVNWLYPLSYDQVIGQILIIKDQQVIRMHKILSKSMFSKIPHRLWSRIIAFAGISEEERWANLSRPKMQHMAEELTRASYTIQGKGPFKDEFVTCGGVKLDEINFKTMESRLIPGLFFAGEIIDVDGLTGGFNFQNAWTTGWLAGQYLGMTHSLK
jgi:predicted Rossmann fold flavoprotein